MKLPTINFNEGGRFLAFAFNLSNLFIYFGISIPYPFYGDKLKIGDFNPGFGWHLRFFTKSFVLYKNLKIRFF